MLILLSPAKKLLSFNKPYQGITSTPVFRSKTTELVQIMKNKTQDEIAELMHLSPTLSALNYQRYQDFEVGKNSYPALFLFQGDVYQSLKPQLWDSKTLEYAQIHCSILSGLYGLLRPLDGIQPHRLEMGTRLITNSGSNLYAFWKSFITEEINHRVNSHNNPFVINLASSEYFSVVDLTKLKAPLLTIIFQERKNNQLKVIGIQAKKARGAMASYLLQNQIENKENIKTFNLLGYTFCKQSSDEDHFYFIRS